MHRHGGGTNALCRGEGHFARVVLQGYPSTLKGSLVAVPYGRCFKGLRSYGGVLAVFTGFSTTHVHDRSLALTRA